MGRNQRNAFIIVGTVILAVAAFVIFQPDDEQSARSEADQTQQDGARPRKATANGAPAQPKAPAKPELITLEVKGDQPVGGVEKIEARNGDTVRFVAKADVEDEVHLHGFDISKDVAPGEPARFSFKADIEGVFEVELEQRAIPIAEVEVRP